MTFHATGEARFADWATASRVFISCAASQALSFVRLEYIEKGRGTNDLVGTVLCFVVAFLATVFTNKPSFGINFSGIMKIASNTNLSNFHFLDQFTQR